MIVARRDFFIKIVISTGGRLPGPPVPVAEAGASCFLQQRQRGNELQAALSGQSGGLPVGAVSIAVAGKADADFVAAEHRIAFRCRVLLVDNLALPSTIGGGLGAEIIEERVAAEDVAVMQHHHSGKPACEPVEQPNMYRI